MAITKKQHEALSQLLTPIKSYLLTNEQQQALRQLLSENRPDAEFVAASKHVFEIHGELFEKLSVHDRISVDVEPPQTWEGRVAAERNTDCACGHADDPGHPKRGLCKRMIGGVNGG